MTFAQVFVLCVLAATLALFIWNRWRYDVVAVMALLTVALAGLVPPAQVFAGFGHPAVVTVAAVLVLSRGLFNAGVVDSLARVLGRVGDNTTLQVAALTGIVALCSAFMNNVGALALLMPVAIAIARRRGTPPSLLLMPLAFGSLLGGMTTLIGTPPNIIIASFRAETGAPPFRMFDFSLVGGGVMLAGVLFICLLGWRVMPRRPKGVTPGELFDISAYIAEVRIRDESRFVNQRLGDLVAAVAEDADVLVLGIFREGQRETMPPMYTTLHAGDVLLLEADSESLRTFIDLADAELVEAARAEDEHAAPDTEALNLREVIITADSPLVGRTVTALDLRRRHGINVVAVARQGGQLRETVKGTRFAVGDILLVQGVDRAVSVACGELGCLPLADRELRLGQPRRVLLALGIFAAALALAAANVLPATTALVGGALAMVLAGLIAPGAAYRGIDLSVIVLLAAMIPVGATLETTGAAHLIADGLARLGGANSLTTMLAIVLIGTMVLSDVVNNAAAAILVAPIAVDLAGSIGASPDPFLMAVAVGASCAFNTPIGHQSNTLVMVPGGYRFGDYWRLGLPLSIVVAVTAIPLILRFWPP